MASQSSVRSLKTIERTVEIVDLIQEMDGARVSELAEALDVSPGTVHAYLSTLENSRYLVKEGDEYHIGLRFLSVGGYASNRKSSYRFIHQKVKELADMTEERAQFIVEEHGRGIHIHVGSSPSAVQADARVGKEVSLHASAAGKSILAHLDEHRIDEIVERWGLPALTDNTISTRDELTEELQTIRERGYSFNRCESIKSLRAVGVPVRKQDGSVLGALSVSGPANRLRGELYEEEIPRQLLGVANEIELKIQYP